MAEKDYVERNGLADALECMASRQAGDRQQGILGVCQTIRAWKTADVVEKKKYDHLLALARKMHTWIFLNAGDEQAAYDEMGLTDEDNALLGYGGCLEVCVNRKEEK